MRKIVLIVMLILMPLATAQSTEELQEENEKLKKELAATKQKLVLLQVELDKLLTELDRILSEVCHRTELFCNYEFPDEEDPMEEEEPVDPALPEDQVVFRTNVKDGDYANTKKGAWIAVDRDHDHKLEAYGYQQKTGWSNKRCATQHFCDGSSYPCVVMITPTGDKVIDYEHRSTIAVCDTLNHKQVLYRLGDRDARNAETSSSAVKEFAFNKQETYRSITTELFSVSSRSAWQDTGIVLSQGTVFEITAAGIVRFDTAGESSGPDGRVFEGTLYAPRDPAGTCKFLVCGTHIPKLSLVGRIGPPDLTDFDNGFFVGSNLKMTADKSGKLYLGYNDGFVKRDRTGIDSGAINDNSGSFDTKISIVRYYSDIFE